MTFHVLTSMNDDEVRSIQLLLFKKLEQDIRKELKTLFHKFNEHEKVVKTNQYHFSFIS